MLLPRRHSRRNPSCVHLIATLTAASVALGACAAEAPPGAATGGPSRSGGRRVVLLALDAADWLALDPLVAAGKLPAFARLRAAGRTAILQAPPPLLSPILWTTIATGRQPEDHGVLDFMLDLASGGQAPVAVTSRRVPALWNFFSDAGRRVAVVGWWATWPAETVNGTIVSDRVAPQLGRPGALDPSAFFPAAAAQRLASALVRTGDVGFEELSRYVPLTRAEYDAARSAKGLSPARLYENRIGHLAAVVAAQRSHAAMAVALLEADRPDFLAVYLEGIDTVSHLFIRDLARGPRAIEAAYRDADALLSKLASSSPPDAWIVVCSDHGFQHPDAGVSEDPSNLAGPAAAWHRPYGIVAAAEARTLVASGSPMGAAASPDLDALTPLDIAPTILHAAGLPVDAGMPGRVVTALLPAEAAARPVERTAAAAAQPPTASTPAVSPVDADVKARLQALGYVSAAPTSLARQNLGEILYRRGNLVGAERELRAVVEAQPTNLSALLWLAKSLRDQGRPREALRAYERALALPGGVGSALVEATDLALSEHRLDDAKRILAGLKPAPTDGAAFHTAQAQLAGAEGQTARCERELRAALASDPTFFEALSRLLDLLLAAQRPREALAFAKRAARRAPGSPRHLALLGEALLAAGDAAAAEEALGRALALAPDGAAVRVELARAQLAQGRPDRAVATLTPAPRSPEKSILLGAAYSQQGRWPQAEAQYREAMERGPTTPELLNGLAWTQIKQGKAAAAADLLSRSLALKGDQPEIRRLLGDLRAGAAVRRE